MAGVVGAGLGAGRRGLGAAFRAGDLRRGDLRAPAFFAGRALRALFLRAVFLADAFLRDALRAGFFRRGAFRFAFLFATVSPPWSFHPAKWRPNTSQGPPFVKTTAGEDLRATGPPGGAPAPASQPL